MHHRVVLPERDVARAADQLHLPDVGRTVAQLEPVGFLHVHRSVGLERDLPAAGVVVIRVLVRGEAEANLLLRSDLDRQGEDAGERRPGVPDGRLAGLVRGELVAAHVAVVGEPLDGRVLIIVIVIVIVILIVIVIVIVVIVIIIIIVIITIIIVIMVIDGRVREPRAGRDVVDVEAELPLHTLAHL